MATLNEGMIGSARGEEMPLGCKYSPTSPQFCIGRQPLCNGCYEHPYPFSAWSVPSRFEP
jgi:hypothetical protein